MGGNDDPYANVCRGKLKIKGDGVVKKKKKKDKEKKLLEQVKVAANEEKVEDKPEKSVSKKTKAELTFLKMKEKTVSCFVWRVWKRYECFGFFVANAENIRQSIDDT